MIKLAYVGAYLESYLAEENNVFQRSIEGLQDLSSVLGFELSATFTHISSRTQAKEVATECETLGIDFVLLQNSSFAMGDLVLEFAKRSFKLGIWASEEASKEGPIQLNNFVSMNLQAGILRRYLKHENVAFKWFYGYVEHPWFRNRLEPTLAALRAIKRLQKAKIGLIGGIAPTFFNFQFDEAILKTKLGVEIGHHETTELFALIKAQSPEAIETAAQAMTERVEGRVELSKQDLHNSATIYLALKSFAERFHYDALAVSDWPAFQADFQIHPGMAFSYLDDTHSIPVASEGDVMGAVSMLLMNELSGQGSLLLDMNDLDFENDALLMWHCGGSPLNFANQQGVSWKNHSTLGRKSSEPPMGAVADYQFELTAVSLMRLSSSAKELFVLDAEVIKSPHKGFDGTRGWLSKFHSDGKPLSLADVVNTVMVKGIEHHFILTKGKQSEALHELAAWLGIATLEPIPYKSYLQPFGETI